MKIRNIEREEVNRENIVTKVIWFVLGFIVSFILCKL
jgi:hypothetical protein